MADTKKQVGARIRSIREKKGWTQEYLAEKTEITAQYVSDIERGVKNPTFDMLIKVQEALGVDIWEMFDCAHETNSKELKSMLHNFIDEASDEDLKLITRLVRAVLK